MKPAEPDTEELLAEAEQGNLAAVDHLLSRYRERLRRMILRRIDRRLNSRIDPSDVIQESLIEANRLLPEYLQSRPMAFYPWLKQIAFNRLIDLHRRHILALRRSVDREMIFSDQSAKLLADVLIQHENVLANLVRDELRRRVEHAISKLPTELREFLYLRLVERLSSPEIAQMTGIPVGTVRGRQFRAILKLKELLKDDQPSGGRQ